MYLTQASIPRNRQRQEISRNRQRQGKILLELDKESRFVVEFTIYKTPKCFRATNDCTAVLF